MMRLGGYAAGLAVALSLLLVGPVQAAPFTPRMNLAYRLAVEWWGQQPSYCGSVERQIVSDESLRDGLGEATLPSALMPPAECHLYIASELADPALFVSMCSLMIHEVGHLEGEWHSTDPASPMYPVVPTQPLCARRQRLLEDAHFWRGIPAARGRIRRDLHRFWAPLHAA